MYSVLSCVITSYVASFLFRTNSGIRRLNGTVTKLTNPFYIPTKTYIKLYDIYIQKRKLVLRTLRFEINRFSNVPYHSWALYQLIIKGAKVVQGYKAI